ncbi:XdhC family protein [Cetobacterium somerae]|uniref:XdhC family protein n=1 Tax=Cetobacterium somerae TaxID=188913 RepID=UPI003D767A19
MDLNILEKIFEIVKTGKKVALVTLTKSSGSTPRKEGALMGVWEESFIGSIGGGLVESKVINQARESLKENINSNFNYDLTREAELGMSCGGTVEGYIKVINPKNRIVIVGAGHIGQKLYQVLENSDFERVILDDREEYRTLFSDIKIGNYSKLLEELKENENTYFVIVTKGHLTDEEALESVLKKQSKYIGMIGSRKKVIEIRKNLENKNMIIPEEKIYSPIGLKISDGSPFEIALEIIAEILQVKNKGELMHRRLKY